MLKQVLYQCPKCGLGENGNEFMHKRAYVESDGNTPNFIQFTCRACGYRWGVPCE